MHAYGQKTYLNTANENFNFEIVNFVLNLQLVADVINYPALIYLFTSGTKLRVASTVLIKNSLV